MRYDGHLGKFPKGIRIFIGTFVIVLSIGFYTGLLFVNQTSTTAPKGIAENYLGNEENDVQNEAAAATNMMKFKKSEREMLTIIHTHVLSMSFIFFLLGGLVWMTKLSNNWKLFLTLEPFVSVILTFGGIYLLWTGILWMTYVVMFSGFLMTATFTISALLVLYQLGMGTGNSQP